LFIVVEYQTQHTNAVCSWWRGYLSVASDENINLIRWEANGHLIFLLDCTYIRTIWTVLLLAISLLWFFSDT